MWLIFLIVSVSVIVTNGTNQLQRMNSRDQYIIRTPGCIIHNTMALFTGSQYSKMKEGLSSITRVMDNRPVRQIRNFEFVVDTVNAKCCYRILIPAARPSISSQAKDVELFTFKKNCEPVFESYTIIEDEHVRFECFVNTSGGSYNEQYMFNNIDKTRVEKKIQTWQDSNQRRLSVLIVGLDATTRKSMKRLMPKTNQIIHKMKAVEYPGFNRIGENSFPNLFGLLMNVNDSELRSLSCKWNGYYDLCPFIWNQFNEAKYVTGFAEDETSAGLYTYLSKGFYQPQYTVDYDYRVSKKFVSKSVLERNWMLFHFARLFTIKTFKNNPYFFYAWSTGLTHDNWNGQITADEFFYTFFKDLHKSQALNNTALFFLSDHGYRGRTPFPHYETNLPFLFVILPKWFKIQYPTAWKNVKENTNRLITIRDVQATILDIIDLEDLTARIPKKPSNQFKISLFHPISKHRSCRTAQIPLKLCSCTRE